MDTVCFGLQSAMNNLHQRLVNWGIWLNYDADILPSQPRCISIESRHLPEAGEVWDEQVSSQPVPNVADAERINKAIQQLAYMERFCISLRYGGMSAVMRMRRIGENTFKVMADRAENILSNSLDK